MALDDRRILGPAPRTKHCFTDSTQQNQVNHCFNGLGRLGRAFSFWEVGLRIGVSPTGELGGSVWQVSGWPGGS